MIIENKLNQYFDGFLVFTRFTFLGIAILLIINQRWLAAGFFLFCASLMFFTVSGTAVDLSHRKVKSYYLIFGVIKTGRWQPVENYQSLTIIPVSKGNHVMNFLGRTDKNDIDEYRVILISKARKEALPLKSCKTPEAAMTSLDEFSKWLKIPVLPVKIL